MRMVHRDNKKESTETVSEDDLFEVARHLTVPTTVKFLVGKTGKSKATLYRWLHEDRRLHPIVQHRSMFWLRGHSKGQLESRIRVPIPPKNPEKFRDMYLRLGWRDEGQRPVSVSYVLLPPDGRYPETDTDSIPSEFRKYRNYVLNTGSSLLAKPTTELGKYFSKVCGSCSTRPHQAPWIESACPKCKSRGCYDLITAGLRSGGLEVSVLHTLVYLSYEYRKELMIVVERALRTEYEKQDYDRFYRLRAALGRRYDELSSELAKAHTYDGSVEFRLELALFNLVTVPKQDAEKAIRTTMDYCRWHQMNTTAAAYGAQQNPLFQNEQDKEEEEFDKLAEPILQEAIPAKLRD